MSVFAKAHLPWKATFGLSRLCAEGETRIVLEAVRYRAPVQPLDVEVHLRTAPPGATTGPVGSAAGAPPNFDALGHVPGRYEPFREGREIAHRCEEDLAEHGFTEMLFVVTTGRAGGRIGRTWIDYTADGYPYTLTINSQLTTCGRQTVPDSGRDLCDPGAGTPESVLAR